ncbi:hypothetical protein HAX54_042795 [Datura stramonium]|uniref:UHRF1-binding protein 1-like n=1 Tax=Datura stramonium TaxID=4076 RepID=A0ABS8W3P6_DATST|nr:hypothetical protein [Datura stramonium]
MSKKPPTLFSTLFVWCVDFQNNFSKTPIPSSSPLMAYMSIHDLYTDCPNDPINNMSTPSSVVSEVHFDSSVGQMEKVPIEGTSTNSLNQTPKTGPLDSSASLLRLGSSPVSSRKKNLMLENVMSESSVDYLFEADLPEQRGQSLNILTIGDQLIVQSLTKIGTRGVQIEDEIWLENVRDPKGGKDDKDIDDDVVLEDDKIASLKTTLQQASTMRIEEPGPMAALCQENKELKLKVGDLTQKLLQALDATNERMTLLLQKFSGRSS